MASMRKSLAVFLLFSLQLANIDAVHWGRFVKGRCITQGYRKYHAKLFDVIVQPWWEDACARTPATVATGVYFDRPTKCVTKADGGVYGEFHVRDTSCNANWGPFHKDKCVKPGMRKYYAQLLNIVGPGEAACKATPATVNGIYFSRPDVCLMNGNRGEFFVTDFSCAPQWPAFSWNNYKCIGKNKALYSSTLPNGAGEWMEWCKSSPAVFLGVYFAQPTRCVQGGGKAHAEFEFPDPCCNLTLPVFEGTGFSSYSNSYQISKTSQTGGICSREENRPPFLPPDTPTEKETLESFVTSFDEKIILARIYAGTQFRVTEPKGFTVVETNFNAFFQNEELQLSINNPGPVFHSRFRGQVVPTTPARVVYNAGGSFPSGTYLTIDVNRYKGQARTICTARLSGCSLAFGWDHRNKRFYMAHVEPDGQIEAVRDRLSLANYLRQNKLGQFPGTSASYIDVTYFGGDGDPFWGYDSRVNVIGFINNNKISILLQLFKQDPHSPGKLIVRTWLRTFPEG